MANVGTISAIADKNTIIFSDALNHASIIDGCRLSKASIKAYSHCDVEELKFLLKQADHSARKLIVTDGVFSMDGDIAPLDKLYELSREYNTLLWWMMHMLQVPSAMAMVQLPILVLKKR